MISWNLSFPWPCRTQRWKTSARTAAYCRLGWQIWDRRGPDVDFGVRRDHLRNLLRWLWPAMDLGISGIISPQKCIKRIPKSTQDTAIAVHPKVGIGWTVCHWQDMDIFIHIYTSIYVKNQHPLTTSVVPMYICATSRFNKALSLLYANRQKARTTTAATDWQQAALWFHMVAEQWSWKHPGELQQAEGLIPEHWGTLNNSWSNKG